MKNPEEENPETDEYLNHPLTRGLRKDLKLKRESLIASLCKQARVSPDPDVRGTVATYDALGRVQAALEDRRHG